MRIILQLVLITIFTNCSADLSAQQKMGRYHKNLFYEADLYFAQGDYYYASELYTQLCAVEPDNGMILGKLGICYFMLPPLKNQAQRFLEMAVKHGDTEAHFYLAKLRVENYRFFDAAALIANYEQKANRQKSLIEIIHFKSSIELSIQMVQTPMPVTITNLGPGVNTAHHDYAPVWDFEGQRLFFTSRRRFDDKSEKDFSEQYDENIYVVDLKETELKAIPAAEPLNSRTNDAAVACSPDGKYFIMYRTSKDGFSGDLYWAERDGESWAQLEKLGDRINSKHQEASASFGSQDASVIYFSSDRPGGFGGKDVYRVQKLPDGSWSQANNLGPEINTPYDEDAPFISSSGALYFSSKGHQNMGGYDVFCALPEGESWAIPANLGFPINTPGDDIFFVMDPSGKSAYFSSERMDSKGLQDLYHISFDEANSIILKGQIFTEREEVPTEATVTLFNEDNNTLEGIFQAEPEKGRFVLALNTNKNYRVRVEAEGFETFEKTLFFSSNESEGYREVNEKLILSR